MAVVGELEGLIRNHDLLISRGSIVDAAKVKALISEYMSKNDIISRFYKPIREKLEELLFCAENNFEKFQEILNYKQITQLEFFYPEFFKEFSRDLNDSASGRIAAGVQLYAGLLAASSLHADRRLLFKTIDHFLSKREYTKVQRIFERLDETARTVAAMGADNGNSKNYILISDENVAKEIGKMLFAAYSEETSRLEGQNQGYAFARNAFLLANIMSTYLPEQELITDSSLVSAAVLYFKELVQRTDIDNTPDLVKFIEQFKNNPATMKFRNESPDLFANYMSSQDVRESLSELIRNLLGKTRFDEARNLAASLEGMIAFDSIFLDHIGSLKENRFYVQAIEMAEKMKMKDMLTDELKVEALRALLSDYSESPLRSNLKRLRNFCSRYNINTMSFPGIATFLREQLEQIERANPDLSADIDQLYKVFHVQKVRRETMQLGLLKIFEPIVFFFTWVFKLFLRVFSGGAAAAPAPKNDRR